MTDEGIDVRIEDFSRTIRLASARVADLVTKAQVEKADRALVTTVLGELETMFEELVVAHEELTVQAEEMQVAQSLIATERRRYAELFELAPDGYVVTDRYGKIVEANQAAGEMAGVPAEALVGSLLVTHVETVDRRAIREYLARTVNKNAPTEVLARWRRGDEALNVGIRATSSGEGGEMQVRWILRDLTQRQRLEHELELAHGELEALSGLTSALRLTADPDSRAATLERIVNVAEATHAQLRVGTTLVDNGELTTAAAASDVARELDDLQHRMGLGPCVEAVRVGERVIADVATSADAWGEFGARARSVGIVEVLALPLMIDDEVRGALNVYGLEPIAPQVAGVLDTLAEQAATAVANAELFASAAKLAQELTTALQSRAPIEQAKGVLMAREGVDADTAFDILRRASQRTNRKLRDIAAEIVQNLSPREG